MPFDPIRKAKTSLLVSHQAYKKGVPYFWPIFLVRATIARTCVVEVNHGLANRLACIASAICGCHILGKKIKFIWNINDACPCRFDDIFQTRLTEISNSFFIDYNDDTTFDPLFLSASKTLLYHSPYYKGFSKGSPRQTNIHNIPFITGQIDDIAIGFSRTLKKLLPVQEVLNLIPNDLTNTIGVHVRRGDLPWQDKSPNEAFFHQIDSNLTACPTSKIYLASDSEEVKKLFKSRYQGSIICHEDIPSRDSIQGMKLALADLLSLSRTTKIIGTWNSSFSWLASAIGLIDLETVGLKESTRNLSQLPRAF